MWLNAAFYVGVAFLGLLMLMMGRRMLATGIFEKPGGDIPARLIRAMPGSMFSLFGMALIGTLVWGYGPPEPLPAASGAAGTLQPPPPPETSEPKSPEAGKTASLQTESIATAPKPSPMKPILNPVDRQWRPASTGQGWRSGEATAATVPLVPVANTSNRARW